MKSLNSFIACFCLLVCSQFASGQGEIRTVVYEGKTVITYYDCGEVADPECSTPSWMEWAMADTWNRLFSEACRLHDNLYNRVPWEAAGVKNGKEISDALFHEKMRQICEDNATVFGLMNCYGMAHEYWVGVASHGLDSYEEGQKKATANNCEPFDANDHLNAGKDDVATYSLTIKTTDTGSAGTDSNIDVILVGEYGRSGRFRLNPMISGDAFESGDVNTVSLPEMVNLGSIKQIILSHDGLYVGAGWHLSYIQVSRGSETDTFHYNKWVDDQTIILNR